MSRHFDFDAALTRRNMIRGFGGGLGTIGLASLLGQASAKELAPHTIPKAKRVIQLFMNGGPFGPDLFDPKPLTAKHEGQRPSELDALRTERKTKVAFRSANFFPSSPNASTMSAFSDPFIPTTRIMVRRSC